MPPPPSKYTFKAACPNTECGLEMDYEEDPLNSSFSSGTCPHCGHVVVRFSYYVSKTPPFVMMEPADYRRLHGTTND